METKTIECEIPATNIGKRNYSHIPRQSLQERDYVHYVTCEYNKYSTNRYYAQIFLFCKEGSKARALNIFTLSQKNFRRFLHLLAQELVGRTNYTRECKVKRHLENARELK